MLAWIAGRALELDEDELNGARRRAMLLLATGGDPARGLELDGRAVTALAGDLDSPERRAALGNELQRLRGLADGLTEVEALADELLLDSDLAWRALAAGSLGEELGEE